MRLNWPALLTLLVLTPLCVDCSHAPPPPPFLDPVEPLTSLGRVTLTGVAQPGSKVLLARTPAFTETLKDDEQTATTAEPTSGKFKLTVPLWLNEGATSTVNHLTVTAQDGDGNKGQESALDIVRQVRHAQALTVTLQRSALSADEGTLEARVEARETQAGVSLSGLDVSLSIIDYASPPAAVTVTTDAAGVAIGQLRGLSRVGAGTLVATAVAAGPEGVITARVPFSVVAGLPATVDLKLSATVAGGALPPSAALTVPADTPVDAAVVVKDAAGNTLSTGLLALSTNAPGALWQGLRLGGVVRSGQYVVVASAADPRVAGTATLTVTSAEAASLVASASPTTSVAGELVSFTAHVEDSYGNVRLDETPAFTASLGNDNQGAAQSLSATVVNRGVATTSARLNKAGSYSVQASGGGRSANLAVTVVPAPPAANGFTFALGTQPATGWLAGQAVPFTYALVDSFNNLVGQPLLVTVNAPSAWVIDNGNGTGTINGILRAGIYTVTAMATSGNVTSPTVPLIVQPNPGQGFNLTLSTSLLAQGGSALAFLTDAFGNQLDVSLVNFTLTPSAQVVGNKLTFPAPGSYSVKACLQATSTVCDTEYLSVQSTVDVTPPTVSVAVTSPTPPAADVPVGGRVAFTVTATDDRALASLSYVAQFGASGSCLVRGGPLLLASGQVATNPPVPFTLVVPTCALPLDRISIVAQASDEAGNSHNGVENATLRVTSVLPLTASTGFLVQTLAYGGSRLRTPMDAVVDPGSGRIIVSNGSSTNGNRAVVIYPDRTQVDWSDVYGQTVTLDTRPKGVEYDPVHARLLFALEGGGNYNGPRIASVDTLGNRNDSWLLSSIDGGPMANAVPEGLALDTGILCAVFPADQRWQCFNNLGNATATSYRNVRDTINLSQPAYVALRGNNLWVSDRGNNKLHLYDITQATPTRVRVVTPSIAINSLADVLVVPGSSNLLVVDRGDGNRNGRLLRVNPNSTPVAGDTAVIASGFDRPNGLAFKDNGVIVVDSGATLAAALYFVAPDAAAATPGTW